MRARLLIGIVVGLLVTASLARPAGAETRPPGPGSDAYIDENGDPTAVATDGDGGPGDQGGSPGTVDNPCRWNVVVEDDFVFGIYQVDSLQTLHSATGRWLEYFCEGIGAVAVDGYFLIPEGGLVDPEALAADALASIGIEPPAIRTSPSAEGRLYVRIPTWMWIEESWWQPYEATAVAGRVTSTVTARPTTSTWLMGDGREVTCTGPGTPWRAGLADDASDCQHTYRSSSATRPSGTYSLEATITLEVTWTSNSGAGGTLPEITRTSTIEVEVGEIQAIGTR